MFSKHRNIIAWILLLISAVYWTVSNQMIENIKTDEVYETSYPQVTTTASNTHAPTDEQKQETGNRIPPPIFLLLFLAIGSASVAIFVLRQKAPVTGPDGLSIIGALLSSLYYVMPELEYVLRSSGFRILSFGVNTIIVFFILYAIRELLGWMLARFSWSWFLSCRLAKRYSKPQLLFLFFIGWILIAFAGIAYDLFLYIRYRTIYLAPFIRFTLTAFFCFFCMWKYGADLSGFMKQLSNFQKNLPITVRDGAFSEAEERLLNMQARHEEAIRTAITSERFKVELITNVSHDLRTPLTAILGYSELLQKETLSAEGMKQLSNLRQKARYMKDLVESLFELTKVSSGVVESKKEKIDLVRLLEQTIGLFDDQLTRTGLVVRRNYFSDTILIITDGGRMHQVFANLLDNAIKYALEGTRIYLEVKETKDSYLVRMTNTSSYEMDFTPDEIMQRFARGDKARSTKGSGLGLAIAQTYTESAGGSFRISPDGDQFSAIVELPKIERNL